MPAKTKPDRRLQDLRPSDFTGFPSNSNMQKCEAEEVAENIMRIKARLGDAWIELSWREYKRERMKDDEFSAAEKELFLDIAPQISDAIGAIAFSPVWAQDARNALRKQIAGRKRR